MLLLIRLRILSIVEREARRPLITADKVPSPSILFHVNEPASSEVDQFLHRLRGDNEYAMRRGKLKTIHVKRSRRDGARRGGITRN